MSAPLQLAAAAHGASSTGWRAGEDLICALPYVDALNADSRRQVDALIEEELGRSNKRPADYLHEMPAPPTLKFVGHPMLAAEYERVKAKQPMQALDTSRYRLDPPAPTKQNDHAAWRASVNNAHAQLEHQYLRILNLELLLKHGDKTWRAQTQLSEAAQKQMENELATTRKRINELNQERKLSQVAAGSELRKLYEDYLRGVSKNFDIDIACSRLQSEVDAMRSALEEAHQEQEQQEAAQGAGAQGEGQEGAQQEGAQQEGGEQQGGGAQAGEQAVAAGEQQAPSEPHGNGRAMDTD